MSFQSTKCASRDDDSEIARETMCSNGTLTILYLSSFKRFAGARRKRRSPTPACSMPRFCVEMFLRLQEPRYALTQIFLMVHIRSVVLS